MALSIGPGFEQWIADHQATPKSDEVDLTSEQTSCIVEVGNPDGSKSNVMLVYNKPTNEVIPFWQADL